MIDIPLEKFEEAKQFLKKRRLHTPLVFLDSNIHAALGNSIYLKAECLQPSGSFKIRGATYCLSLLSPKQKEMGIIAYSTGNHSQAVALAARSFGIKATIVMSPEALPFKVEATKSYGAHVIMTSPQERKKLAEELAHKHGYYLIPPFDHPDIIAGQGTIGLEILDEIEPAAVFVPIGGGGLISGIAMAIKKMKSFVKIIGVEADLEDDAFRTFQSGKLISMPGPSSSIADAIKIPSLGEITYPIVKRYVDDITTVNEQQIIDATLMTLERGHLLVEPSGALALAAALVYKKQIDPKKPIICLASGGNVLLPTICNLKI
ncbi:MAG TPA: threonine/serine dehydratase [Chlamydiales bacterium]|nr:threonine/serine dehydratase [Chlamydiales bacterium]